jgi:GNAT superfamily N-acetyltransferase
MSLTIETHTHPDAIAPYLERLADLRITVFRAWPYLYDGDPDYEARYLARFAKAEGAVIVIARDGDMVVGAATGAPLAGEHAAFLAPFKSGAWEIERIFYNCESVLLPEYRGRGVYRRFFEERERWARDLGGFDQATFCGVVRPEDHPLRPEKAEPLDPVWRHFGYVPADGLVGRFAWTDIDQTDETEKPMQFWIKQL